MKKMLIGIVFAIGTLSAISFAACLGPYCYDDTGPHLPGGFSKQPLTQGGVAASTATTTGTGGFMLPVFLATGNGSAAAIQGSVIMATTTTSGSGVNGAVANGAGNITTVIGIADAAASSGTVVNVVTTGVTLALTTGTVNAGDILVTTTTVGYLATNNSPSNGAGVATALTAGTSGGGLTRVLVW